MYQIVKGWPSQAAIDLPLFAAAGETIVPGTLATIKADGTLQVANYAAAGTDNGLLCTFIIDAGAMDKSLLGILSPIVVECDSDCFDAATYTAGQEVTAKAGKFSAITGTEPAVGRVVSYNAVTGKLRVLVMPTGIPA